MRILSSTSLCNPSFPIYWKLPEEQPFFSVAFHCSVFCPLIGFVSIALQYNIWRAGGISGAWFTLPIKNREYIEERSRMESGAVVSSEKEQQQGASYTYWVRKITEDAAPLPVPHKLTPEDALPRQSPCATLGSVWNRAGTWEEKSLNNWATPRIKELIISVGSFQFSFGRAEVEDVTKCVGDAFMVIVRNKKRVGYTYELTLKVKGEWIIRGEKKLVGGHIDVPEFSFGELDDLQMEVRLSEGRDLLHQDKIEICNNLNLFLQPVREKLLQFEQELIDR